MNSTHLRHKERFQRVTTYIDSQPEVFPEDSKAAIRNASLKQGLARMAELDEKRSDSMSSYKQATAARQKAHRRLTDLVGRTINTAEAFADEHPDTKGMFVRPQVNSSDQTLIADARSIAGKAATLVGLFTENEMPATFINDMRSLADDLDRSMQLQTTSANDRKGANAEMKEVIRRLSEVIERLDAIIRNKFADDPAKIVAWEMARRLEQPPHSKHDDEDDDDDDAPAPQP